MLRAFDRDPAFAPDETTPEMPSSRARRRVVARASSSVTTPTASASSPR